MCNNSLILVVQFVIFHPLPLPTPKDETGSGSTLIIVAVAAAFIVLVMGGTVIAIIIGVLSWRR